MKTVYFVIASALLALAVFSGCQKELSYPTTIAKGSLKEDSSGDCRPTVVYGNYVKDTALNTTNYVDVQVNFSQTGNYTIYTDTVNGYYFRGSNAVAITGVSTIRIYGVGRPTAAGLNIFKLRFDSSMCYLYINVLGSGGGTEAVYTLTGAPNTCSNYVLSGSYASGIPTNTTNFVTLSVNVTSPGSYNIYSNLSNGISFTGSGTFNNTGVQTVVLQAAGTPIATGTFNYSVTASSAGCGFSVSVVNGGIPPSDPTDYIVTTTGTNYGQSVDNIINDSLHSEVLANSIVLSGKVYRIIRSAYASDPTTYDSFLVRKNGAQYFRNIENIDLSALPGGPYTLAKTEVKILDTAAAVSMAWNDTIINTALGQVIVRDSVMEKNATATIHGITYTNSIIKMSQKYFIVSILGGATSVGETITWYTRGKGILYQTIINPTTGTVLEENRTFRWDIR